jgi:hypothetical protein
LARHPSPPRRRPRLPFPARTLLIAALVAVVSVVGYQALRFGRSCFTLDGARAAIETHVKAAQARRIARVLKAADREQLAARTAVRVTTLACGPTLLGGVTCRARYTVNGRSAEQDHYFRMSYSLLVGWEAASVRETSGLRYSLTPCRCSWTADGREP